jgi:NADPH:quinone reductase and related Zn-dependent oxidoreductases
MSTKATAARIYEYGEPDVFRFETMDVPDPVGHEVLVRNTVIGLNFVDIYYRRGALPVPEFPAIIGERTFIGFRSRSMTSRVSFTVCALERDAFASADKSTTGALLRATWHPQFNH